MTRLFHRQVGGCHSPVESLAWVSQVMSSGFHEVALAQAGLVSKAKEAYAIALTQLPSGAPFASCLVLGNGSPLKSINQKRMPLFFPMEIHWASELKCGIQKVIKAHSWDRLKGQPHSLDVFILQQGKPKTTQLFGEDGEKHLRVLPRA